MSHFTCLVITASPDDLKRALQPFHEYECTGVMDEHVVWVDHTDEVAADWEKDTQTAYRSPDSTVYEGHEAIFYRNPTPDEMKEIGPHAGGSGIACGVIYRSQNWGDGRGYRPKVYFVPSGFVEFQQPVKDRYPTIEAYAEDCHGYTVNEAGRIGRFTNPSKKWDWWQIGGRWSGKLLLRDGRSVDQARWGDVDITRMRNDAERKARETYAKLQEILAGLTLPPSWSELRHAHDAAREAWLANEAVTALRKNIDFALDSVDWIEVYRGGLDAYVAAKRRDALATFAVLKDGCWYERGEMGWWACVSNEKESADWSREVEDLLSDLPADAWLTVVDCHI